MSSYYCAHDHASGNSSNIPPISVCLIKFCIGRVQDAQAGLAHRGGIFLSKSHGIDYSISVNCVSHRDWTNQWRSAKVDCYRALQKMEELTARSPEDARDWGIEEALRIWEEAKEECCRVPGLELEATEFTLESHSDDDTVQSELLMKQEFNRPDRSDWKIAMSKRKLRQISASNKVSFNVDERLLQEMDDFTKRLGRQLKTGESNQSNVLAGKTATIDDNNIKLSESEIVSAHPSTPRSAFKSRLFPKSQRKRNVVFSPLATMVLDRNDPAVGSEALTKSHNKHTLAEHSHGRSVYSRYSPTYQPGVWSSSEGYEKADTSHSRTDWGVYESIQRALNQPDING